MITTQQIAVIDVEVNSTKGDTPMITTQQIAFSKANDKESTTTITAANLIRWAGLSALLAGICYVLVGIFHPANVPSSVTTTRWAIVHVLACAMCFFGRAWHGGTLRQASGKSPVGLVWSALSC